jgi:hypothetical protein
LFCIFLFQPKQQNAVFLSAMAIAGVVAGSDVLAFKFSA